MRLHIVPAIGMHQLAKLLPQHVQAMMNGMGERGLSPRSVQYTWAILRRALNQALKWGPVTKNAAALTDAPRVVRPEVRALDPGQARRFLDTVRGDRLEALWRWPWRSACGRARRWACVGEMSTLTRERFRFAWRRDG